LGNTGWLLLSWGCCLQGVCGNKEADTAVSACKVRYDRYYGVMCYPL